MKKKTIVLTLLVLSFVVVLTGCSSVTSLTEASNVLSGASNAMSLYRASKSYSMVKDIQDMKPVFDGFEHAMIEIKIVPRDEQKAAELIAAFEDNFSYLIKKDLEMMEIPTTLCEQDSCSENTLTIQFKESSYDENIVQKIALGSKLRGNLYYIDSRNNTVIDQVHLENAKNYLEIMNMIHASLIKGAINSNTDQKNIEDLEERTAAFDPVKPEYKELFEKT